MAATLPPSRNSTLLAIPLEIRRCIYGFCIPKNLTFNCSDDMYYQNRPTGWIEPPWHSNKRYDEYVSSEENAVEELQCLQEEWRLKDKSILLEETDVASVDEDSLDHDMEGSSEGLELGSCDFPFSFLNTSALPSLLLLCHQINDEVETMLYQENTFTVNLHDKGPYHVEQQFSPRKREKMRNIILVLRPIGLPFQPTSLIDPGIWDSVLGNLLTLGVIVEQPEPPLMEWLEDSEKAAPEKFLAFLQERKKEAAAEWMTWLLPIFEYLVQAIPKQAEIVVDVTEEEDTVQALEFFQKGPFRFQRLPAADSIPNRLGFAWESASRESWFQDHDDRDLDERDHDDYPTSCRDIINDSDYDYYYSD
ncbi:hypothetical protein F4803DRAFT_393171 [Xylaria telfairii]|nr:hypothetical protein F4803DRAFT_393171 [Xylaria telfairii]